MKKYGKTSGAVALGLGLAAAAPFAVAQQAPDAVMEKIEITGSFIRRADVETPSPVQVITAEQMKASGFTTVAEVLTSITANNNGALTQSFTGAFAQGASGVALRGLTVGATLVLIDGHRMAPYPVADDGQRQFVDISSIPFDAVERIEVLKDGASATYGSDAMAGVVNVILKKSIKGVSIAAEQGWTHRGGGETSHVTGTIGFGDLVDDGHNAYVSLEYRHQDPIFLEQRPYINHLDYSAVGGVNLTPGGNNIAGGGYHPASTTGYFVSPNISIPSTGNPYAIYGYLPGCNATAQFNNQCTFAHPWDIIEPATQNINVISKWSQNLGNGWTGSLTASWFRSSDMIPGAPYSLPYQGNTYTGLAPGPNHTVIGTVNTVQPMLAPLPASIAALFNSLGDTAAHTGALYPLRGYTMDLGQQNTYVQNDAYRFVGDLKGTLGGWDLDATYGWTKDAQENTQVGSPIYSVLSADLASGAYVLGGNNSAAVRNAIAPAQVGEFDSLLTFAGVHGTRELFTLPGGKAAVATGADFYYHSVNYLPPPLGQTAQQIGNFLFSQGTQSDWSVYAEGYAPVLKTLEIDAALRYDHVNTYGSDTTPKIGFKFTPIQAATLRGTFSKGFRAPNPVEANSSAAGGYAGSPPDNVLCPNQVTGVNPATLNGNYINQCAVPLVNVTAANPQLQPEKSTSKTVGLILEPLKWISFSADYYDIKIDNMIIAGSQDPLLGAYGAAPVRGTPVAQSYRCTANDPLCPAGTPAGTVITRTPSVGNLAYYQVPYINLGYVETKGFEFNLANHFDLGAAGKIRTDLDWTLISDYVLSVPAYPQLGVPALGTYQLVGTHGPNQISADTGTPRNRAKFNITWDKGPLEVSTTINYTSSFGTNDPSWDQNPYGPSLSTCQGAFAFASEYHGGTFFPAGNPPTNLCKIPSFTDVDLYVSYTVDKHWRIHGSIGNVFDREAPTDAQTYASPNLNTAYHLSGAIGRSYLVGAAYDF